MKVYLLTLLNSNFEEWHEKFPDKDINEFPFSVEKMNQSWNDLCGDIIRNRYRRAGILVQAR